MQIRTCIFLLQTSLALAIASCDSDTEPHVLQPCAGPVTVTVTPSGDAPVFNWSPACRVSRLAVFSVPGHDAEDLGTSLWRVQSSTLLVPPIQYGVVPPTAQAFPPASLLVGNVYVVIVDRDSSGVVLAEGSGTFVR